MEEENNNIIDHNEAYPCESIESVSEGHAQTWKSNQVLIGLYCLLQNSL